MLLDKISFHIKSQTDAYLVTRWNFKIKITQSNKFKLMLLLLLPLLLLLLQYFRLFGAIIFFHFVYGKIEFLFKTLYTCTCILM